MINLETLNEVQKKAVLDTDGSILVFAGAGSGKTRVLTMRIANIIESKLAWPSEILAITFTNKAANEMKERLMKEVGDIGSMWVCTIHSMCTRILRSDIDKIGFDKNFSIYTDTEKDRLVKEVIAKDGYEDDLFKNAKWHISNLKSLGLSVEDYKTTFSYVREIDDFCNIYVNYEALLKRNNALDFDDLLMKTYELLSTSEEVRNKYSERFKYVHIDEFQDTNNIQYNIVKMLCHNHKNIFAVGDDDQSIYGFRGANVENILNFEKDYTDAKVYKLEQNYRSTKKILEIANAVITKNKTRTEKALWCDNEEGDKAYFHSAKTESEEGAYVANVISALTSQGECKNSEIAVLYRMNALSRSFEQEFLKYNIPYKVFGGMKFYDRKEIKDLSAYLRAIVNPKDTEAIRRIINVPKRGIGETTVTKLNKIAAEEGKYFYEVLENVEGYSDFTQTIKNKLVKFRDVYFSLMNDVTKYTALEFANELVNRTQFREQFNEKSEENTSRKLNIEEFLSSLKEFMELNKEATIVEFLESITLSSTIDEGESQEDSVTLATVHAVKGLEFKVVFVIGLDEKYFPIVRPETTDSDIEEERRLMYVAVTRAREKLILTRCESRYSFYTQSRMHMVRSRFVDDLKDILGIVDKAFKDEPRPKLERKKFAGSSFSDSFVRTSTEPSKSVTATKTTVGDYSIGDKVSHPKFKEGTIVNVKGEGDNIICEVAFAGVGVKSLAIKYAPLTKI